MALIDPVRVCTNLMESFFTRSHQRAVRRESMTTLRPLLFELAIAALVVGGCASDPSKPECSDVSGTACDWAGVRGSVGFNGDNIDRRDAWLYYASDLTFAPDGTAWVADWNNHRVRTIGADGIIQTVIGTDYEGDGSPGETDRLPEGNPQGALGIEVALNHPMQVQFMPDGRVLLAAWHNNKVRIYDPATKLV